MADFRRRTGGLVTVVLLAVVVFGVIADHPTPDERLASLGDRIACPVCDGASIADSPSTYARDMLSLVEEQIAQGWSDEEIMTYFEARYTDAIRLDAPADSSRLLLWLAPLGVAGAGAYLALGTRRREHGDA